MQDPRTGGRRHAREYAEMLLVAILIVLFATTFVVRNSVIPSPSMENTLLVGDYLLVNRIMFTPVDRDRPWRLFAQRPLRHGDVVVFKFPKDPSIDYIKRVVGLPGDEVEIRARQVVRNGEALEEPYKVHATSPLRGPRGRFAEPGADDLGPLVVPEGQVFVLGDNRDHSADSREWGLVPQDHVTGRAVVVFWSRAPRIPEPGAGGETWLAKGLRSVQDLAADVRWRRIGTTVR